MKKLIILGQFFIFLVLPLSGIAQMMLGPKVGLNMAGQFKSDYTVPKIDIAYGAALDIPISGGFSIQGEFLISKKGYREDYKGKEVFDELTATYLEIPAMAKYTHRGINWGYFGQAGAYWSYWNKAEYKSSIDGENIITEIYPLNPDFDQDGYRDVRSDFGLVAEAGVTYDNLGSGILALGVRYSHGLVATGEFQTPPADYTERINRVITISLTYFLYL